VHYFDRNAEGTYRLRVATSDGELLSDTVVVAPKPIASQR